ncbi:hypothetical protein VNI00_012476 [Paramarasmius palmivorus]|uniref:Uncharacterized protein n=1 Tax=Paramarasmius palmivorus TaxID=297713 RepID=A0AAW0C5N6_9AGAR
MAASHNSSPTLWFYVPPPVETPAPPICTTVLFPEPQDSEPAEEDDDKKEGGKEAPQQNEHVIYIPRIDNLVDVDDPRDEPERERLLRGIRDRLRRIIVNLVITRIVLYLLRLRVRVD